MDYADNDHDPLEEYEDETPAPARAPYKPAPVPSFMRRTLDAPAEEPGRSRAAGAAGTDLPDMPAGGQYENPGPPPDTANPPDPPPPDPNSLGAGGGPPGEDYKDELTRRSGGKVNVKELEAKYNVEFSAQEVRDLYQIALAGKPEPEDQRPGSTPGSPPAAAPAPAGGGRGGGGMPVNPNAKLPRMVQLALGVETATSEKELADFDKWSTSPQGQVFYYNQQVGQIKQTGDERNQALLEETARGAQAQLAFDEKKIAFEHGQQLAAAHRARMKEVARVGYEEKIAKADKAVDDFRIGDDRSWAERIFGGIVAAIGAYGAGMTGGKNEALEILQRNIDRRIDAQKTELLKRKERAGTVRSDLAEYMNHFQDLDQAAENLRIRYLREHAAAMNKVADQTKSNQAKISLQQGATELLLKADMRQKKALIDAEMAALPPAMGGGGPVKKGEGVSALGEAYVWEAKGDDAEDWRRRWVPEGGFFVNREGDKDNAVKAWRAYGDAQERGKAMLEIIQRPGLEWGAKRAQLEMLAAATVQSFSTGEEMGVVTREDRAAKALLTGTEWLDSDAAAAAAAQTIIAASQKSQARVPEVMGGEAGTWERTGPNTARVRIQKPQADIAADREAKAEIRAGRNANLSVDDQTKAIKIRNAFEEAARRKAEEAGQDVGPVETEKKKGKNK